MIDVDAQRQKCKACGRVDYFDFHVPDEIWQKVVSEELVNRVVCLACFDRFAYRKNIDYAQYVQTLYFAGDQVVFTFQVVSTTLLGTPQ